MPQRELLIPAQIRRNNFDLLRLLFAGVVLFSHCFLIFYGSMNEEPFFVFSDGQTELGVLAVYGFFVISGFLILRSFENSISLSAYFTKRILRIVPGFFVAFFFSVFIVAPLGTLGAEHAHGEWNWFFVNARWFRLTADLFSLQPPHVSGTFTTLPVPAAVNASMWTIQHEAVCYLLVPLLVASGLWLRKKLWLTAFCIVFIIAAFLDLPELFFWKEANTPLINWPGYLPRFMVYFLAGVLCHVYRDKLIRSRFLAVISVAVSLACLKWGGFHWVFPFAGTYLLFYVAFNRRFLFPDFARHGDFSYGTYLYAWPVQQLTLFYFRDQITFYGFFMLSWVITLVFAFASWHLVERRFIRIKESAISGRSFIPSIDSGNQ